MFSISEASAGPKHMEVFPFIVEELPHYAGELAAFQ